MFVIARHRHAVRAALHRRRLLLLPGQGRASTTRATEQPAPSRSTRPGLRSADVAAPTPRRPPAARRWLVVLRRPAVVAGRSCSDRLDAAAGPGHRPWSSSTTATLRRRHARRSPPWSCSSLVRAGCHLGGGGGGPTGQRAAPRRPSAPRWPPHLVAVGPAGLDEERAGEVGRTVGTGVDSLDAYVTAFLPGRGAGRRSCPVLVLVDHRRARPVDHAHPAVHRTDADPAARRHRWPHPGPHPAPVHTSWAGSAPSTST